VPCSILIGAFMTDFDVWFQAGFAVSLGGEVTSADKYPPKSPPLFNIKYQQYWLDGFILSEYARKPDHSKETLKDALRRCVLDAELLAQLFLRAI
ncbi:MAG: hypothetical protein PHS30_05570, partial [Bacteroidales bacterium]|nr:hypothetical protein [Bacteroidales bacterium]